MANEDKFNGKAGFYNSRPLYPQECIDYLAQKFNLRADSVIADIGAGTGILTKPFLHGSRHCVRRRTECGYVF